MENDLLMRKVPALASVERKLAGSRHLLDQASRRFGRMQTFMRRRMLAESREELARISSEAIVDILECEIGLLWCLRCPQGPDSFFVSPGQELDATARESLLGWTKRRTGGSGSKAAPPLPDSLGFRDWLVEEIRAEDGEIQGLLIAANSWQKGSFYDALDDASAHSFAAFGEQVGALMEKRRWILARGFAIRDESGKPRRMIGIHIDFTSFKQLEEKLRNAKSAAERASQAKSEFLAKVSHELRTPLNGMLGSVELLQGTLLNAEQQKLVDIGNSSGRWMLSIIGDGHDLAIARELVSLMGGSIRLERPGRKGCRFIATMPVGPIPKEAPKPGLPADRRAEFTGRVLVVDDDPVSRELAALMLKRMGLQVDTACDGRERLGSLPDTEYDLAIVDCWMPEFDGLEMTLQLRAGLTPGRPRVPIIALTANTQQSDIDSCLEAGMDGCIPKPLCNATLHQCLDRFLKDSSPGSLPNIA